MHLMICILHIEDGRELGHDKPPCHACISCIIGHASGNLRGPDLYNPLSQCGTSETTVSQLNIKDSHLSQYLGIIFTGVAYIRHAFASQE